MSALVSIGIPCYNNAQWLAESIESALAQTWPATEVIVVDDGSTDGSLAVARGFGQHIRLETSAHRGAPHARNTALQVARGEWVQFLDADDTLEPEKLSQQFAESRDGFDAEVIYSPVWVETCQGSQRERARSELDAASDLYCQWLSWQLPQTGGALWRRAALTALGGWKEEQPCCQEHELYLRALKAGLRFVRTPTPHAVYRIWSDNTLCRKNPCLVIQEKTALIDQLRAWMEAQKLWNERYAQVAGRACFEMSRTLAQSDLAEAVAYHEARAARGLIHLRGPAAPLYYKVAHRVLGFARAEKLAASRR